jgi:hypothetical protein
MKVHLPHANELTVQKRNGARIIVDGLEVRVVDGLEVRVTL